MHFPPGFIMDSFFHLPISLSTKEGTWFYKNYGQVNYSKEKKNHHQDLPADTAPVIVKIYSSSLIGYR